MSDTYKLLWLGLCCISGFIIASLYVTSFWEKLRKNFIECFCEKKKEKAGLKNKPEKIEYPGKELKNLREPVNEDGSIRIQDTIKFREEEKRLQREAARKNLEIARKTYEDFDNALHQAIISGELKCVKYIEKKPGKPK